MLSVALYERPIQFQNGDPGSSAAPISSEDLEDTQRPPEGRDDVDTGRFLARSGN